MRRRLTLTLTVFMLLCFAPLVAHAAPPLWLIENEAFEVSVLLQEKPLTTYALKIRFSNHPTTCVPSCDGFTRHENSWLTQSSPWATFPIITTNASGQAMTTLVGKAPESRDFLFVQIALRDTIAEKVEVIQTYPVTWLTPTYPLLLEAFDPLGKRYTEGSFHLFDQDGIDRLLPLTDEPRVVTAVEKRIGYVQFLFPDGTEGDLQSYRLTENGLFTIQINPPPPKDYQPRLVVVPRPLIPNQPQRFTLETTEPYNDTVQWYRNGEVTEGYSIYLDYIFQKSGNNEITAVLANGQTARVSLTIQPITNIQVERILPNPIGRDTKQEELILRNNHPFPVTLQDWQLKSRTSGRTFRFSASIGAHQTATVLASNFLTNNSATYDLYSPEGLIDTFAYADTYEGDYLIKSGLMWISEHPSPEKSASTAQQNTQHVSVTGTVTKPSGNTVDIITDAGEAVRLVIHSSYRQVKPRLHKGDRVEATGIWQRSRRGPYISIRSDGALNLLRTASQAKATPAKKKSNPIKQAFIPTASAQTKSNVSRPPPIMPEHTLLTALPFETPPSDSIRWLISLVISFGILLIFPDKRNSV